MKLTRPLFGQRNSLQKEGGPNRPKHLLASFSVFCVSVGLTLLLTSCGGSGSGITNGNPGGCNGLLTGASFVINYAARSRDTPSSTLGSSALSGRVVVTGGAPNGSDLVININRSPAHPEAHAETYAVPNVKTGTFPVVFTAYADANQAGAVVGTANLTESISCNAFGNVAFSFTKKVATVTATPQSLTLGAGTKQLAFVCKDGSGAVIAVTPGSAIFAVVAGSGTAATVTADGIATPVSAGTVQVTATVDGIKSAAATITVGTTGGPGTYAPFVFATTINQGPHSPSGAFVASNSKATPTASVQGAVWYPPAYGASLGSSDAQLVNLTVPSGNNYSQAQALNNLGLIAGVYGVITAGNNIFNTPDYTTIPCYWTAAGVVAKPLAMPAGETNPIRIGVVSKSGAIYGHTRLSLGSGQSYGNNYVWPTPTSQPIKLRPYAALNYEPGFSISDAGILIIQGTDLGTVLYKAPYTAAPTVLKTPDGTPGGISVQFTISPGGTLFGTQYNNGSKGFYFLSPNYTSGGVFLPGTQAIYSMNSLGQACGESDPGGGNFGDALFWTSVTATPETVPSGSPGNQAIKAVALFDDGTMEVGDDYGNFYWVKRS